MVLLSVCIFVVYIYVYVSVCVCTVIKFSERHEKYKETENQERTIQMLAN